MASKTIAVFGCKVLRLKYGSNNHISKYKVTSPLNALKENAKYFEKTEKRPVID